MSSMVETSWPPKSPREALLSSPGGRRRYEEMQHRRANLGSSPLKHSTTTPNLRSKATQLLADGAEDEEDGEDEDEETLQLKLAAIEARLKLKQLQKGRGKPGTPRPESRDEDEPRPRPASALSFSPRPRHSYHSRTESDSQGAKRSFSPDEVQVPLSPTRRPAPAADPISPRRYLLGIDKGLKGSDVSLKRPPSSRASNRPTSATSNRGDMVSQSGKLMASITAGDDVRRGKTFSERMAEGRMADKARKERAERLQLNRSSAFQFDKNEVEGFKAAAEARRNSPTKSPTKPRPAESFSRDDILNSYNNLKPSLKRSQTTPSGRKYGPDRDSTESGPRFHRRSNKSESQALPALPSSSTEYHDNEAALEKAPDASKFEGFSGLHLSNRILPHSFIGRTLSDKKVLRIPDLLRTVKGPAFELPEDIDGDFVVFGIVASKSAPKEKKEEKNKSTKETDPFDDGLNNTKNYMAITLTDLKWTIDLFLFDTAFPRYYRISEGILIAILNPTIMPPPKHKLDTNRFSLAISSSDDKVLEVGYAQDIGFCKAVRKDGKTCQSWLDARKTEFCDFHVDLQVRRTQSQRMGVNSGGGMFGPGGRSGSRTGFFGDGKRGGGRGRGGGLKQEGPQYDRFSQSTYYVAPAAKSRTGGEHSYMPTGQSAASLIDADDDDPFIAAGMMGRGAESKEERFRKKIAEQKREKEFSERLLSRGAGGVGADYIRAKNAENISTPRSGGADQKGSTQVAAATPSQTPMKDHLSSLTAFRKADSVKLSPMKRAHDGDRPHGSGVKKTRFITSKGIKEAGRDSLGGVSDAVVTKTSYEDDDDDDELDIV